ncbi:hypothetical protein FHX69_1916 [Prauserella muralis]|nr:hypothetical protein FHX69_1916 [Prauserella muralis]
MPFGTPPVPKGTLGTTTGTHQPEPATEPKGTLGTHPVPKGTLGSAAGARPTRG